MDDADRSHNEPRRGGGYGEGEDRERGDDGVRGRNGGSREDERRRSEDRSREREDQDRGRQGERDGDGRGSGRDRSRDLDRDKERDRGRDRERGREREYDRSGDRNRDAGRPKGSDKRTRSSSPGRYRDDDGYGPPAKRAAHDIMMGRYNEGPRRDADMRHSRGPMMTYKQFISDLDDDVSPEEAERRYAAYKDGFKRSRKEAYFQAHKEEEGLREKYDPVRVEELQMKRIQHAQKAAQEFLSALQNDTLIMSPEAEPLDSASARKAFDRCPRVAAAPFTSAARVAADIATCRDLARKLDKEKGVPANLLLADNENASSGSGSGPPDALFKILVPPGPEASSSVPRSLEGLELLEALAVYLWRTHGVDYYGAREVRGLPGGLMTWRGKERGAKEGGGGEEEEEREREAGEKARARVDACWSARLSEAGEDPVSALLGSERVEKGSQEYLDSMVRKIKDEKYGWKYGCSAPGCSKLFHGPEFVLKHLKLKHPELLAAHVASVKDDIYKANYLNDPDAPVDDGHDDYGGSHGNMAHRLGPRHPNDRRHDPHGRGDPMDARGDRRGGRGGHDRGYDDYGRDGGGGGRERAYPGYGPGMPHDPMHPYPMPLGGDGPMSLGVGGGRLPPGGPRGGFGPGFDDRPPLDGPPVFDPFGPPPMPGPYGAMPPMLIPVPGAGPLGPFVPAPPEIAMRMMRERGMPPPVPGRYNDFDGPPPPFDDGPRGPPRPDPRDRPGPDDAKSPEGARRTARGPVAGRLGAREPDDEEVEGAGGKDVGKERRSGGGEEGGRMGPYGYGFGGFGRGMPPMFPPHMGGAPDPRGMRSYRDLDVPDDEISVIDYRSL